jgi:hypothetical protein
LRKNVLVETADGWSGRVLDISAVGLRVSCARLLPEHTQVQATLRFEDDSQVQVKLGVVWTAPVGTRDNAEPEQGLEILEAQKDFYDALPKILPEPR